MTRSSDSMDISLSGIYKSWYAFRAGKRASQPIITFEYNLENNLYQLASDLHSNKYTHGPYSYMTVNDSKPRSIAVSSVRDRVVHRLLYDYLMPRWNKRFDPDVWSCRPDKGLVGVVHRAEQLIRKYPNAWVFRADVTKFFDSINQATLFELLQRLENDTFTLELLKNVLQSFCISGRPTKGFNTGIPLGNLTSQIFANIYLHELDRFIRHTVKPLAYMRYGDDFIVVCPGYETAQSIRRDTQDFLLDQLGLRLHSYNNVVVKASHGIHYLGSVLYPSGRYLKPSTMSRISQRVNWNNHSSYYGTMLQFGNQKQKTHFLWTRI